MLRHFVFPTSIRGPCAPHLVHRLMEKTLSVTFSTMRPWKSVSFVELNCVDFSKGYCFQNWET